MKSFKNFTAALLIIFIVFSVIFLSVDMKQSAYAVDLRVEFWFGGQRIYELDVNEGFTYESFDMASEKGAVCGPGERIVWRIGSEDGETVVFPHVLSSAHMSGGAIKFFGIVVPSDIGGEDPDEDDDPPPPVDTGDGEDEEPDTGEAYEGEGKIKISVICEKAKYGVQMLQDGAYARISIWGIEEGYVLLGISAVAGNMSIEVSEQPAEDGGVTAYDFVMPEEDVTVTCFFEWTETEYKALTKGEVAAIAISASAVAAVGGLYAVIHIIKRKRAKKGNDE